MQRGEKAEAPRAFAVFVWLISHQPTVLFSQNKPAITNQPAVLFSQNKLAPAISHQPNKHAACLDCQNSSLPLSLHHIKYTKRHMFGVLNIDEIKNYLHDCDGLCDTNPLILVRLW
jgi:hypothetical protein